MCSSIPTCAAVNAQATPITGRRESYRSAGLIFAPATLRALLIGRIRLPEVCGYICFGGPKRNRLFMTASQSLYAVYVETQGAHIT